MRIPSRSPVVVSVIGVLGCLGLMFMWSYGAQKTLGTGPLASTGRFVTVSFREDVRDVACLLTPGVGDSLIFTIQYTAVAKLPPDDRKNLNQEMGQMAYFTLVEDPEMKSSGKSHRIAAIRIVCREEVSSGCSTQTSETTDTIDPFGRAGSRSPAPGQRPPPPRQPPARTPPTQTPPGAPPPPASPPSGPSTPPAPPPSTPPR